jgi:hypothetical protein
MLLNQLIQFDLLLSFELLDKKKIEIFFSQHRNTGWTAHRGVRIFYGCKLHEAGSCHKLHWKMSHEDNGTSNVRLG